MTPRPRPTPQSLAKNALDYLARYAASEGSLRRTLETRIRRAAMVDPMFAADKAGQQMLRNIICQLVEKYKNLGVLDDAALTKAKTASLRNMGYSRRAIVQKLTSKGLAPALVDDALEHVADGASEHQAELTAAIAYIKRKKMGPFRTRSQTPDKLRKDMAALARAGFSLSVAQQALKANADIFVD